MCFAHVAHLRDVLCVHFACIEIYIRKNDQGHALSLLTLAFRFDVIFHRHFGGRFCRGNEHLWHHANKEVVDFHTPTFEREMGMALDVLHTGYHPCILMYMLDELFFVFKKLRADDFDMQYVVAYEILQIALCQCTEWCGSKKKTGNTLGDAYPCMDLWDADSLECLAWAVYDGVFVPGNKPALSGHYNWDHVVAGTLICLIFWGQTEKEHCGPVTIASFNAKQAMELAQQQGLPWYRESPTMQSKVTIPPWAMSSCSTGGAQATVLDYAADSDGESPFPETSQHCVMRGSPRKAQPDPMWEPTKWLEVHIETLREEDVPRWQLVVPLMDAGTAGTWELTKHFLALWQWTVEAVTTNFCTPAPYYVKHWPISR